MIQTRYNGKAIGLEEGKISLVLPFYNAEPYFSVALDSILQQTFSNVQLLLINDGSTDRSEEVYASFAERLTTKFREVQLIRHQANLSQAAAMATGLPCCTGEYLFWMDADDRLLPENLQRKAEFLDRRPDLDFVRCNGWQIDLTGREPPHELASPRDKAEQNLFNALLAGSTYCHNGCYMARTAALFRHYSEAPVPVSRQGQNMQLLLPLASSSRCGYLDEILFEYRTHSDSHSRSFHGLENTIARIQGFSALYREILRHCDCDQPQTAAHLDAIILQQKEDSLQAYANALRNKLSKTE